MRVLWLCLVVACGSDPTTDDASATTAALTVVPLATGQVTSSPPGITCGGGAMSCMAAFPTGTRVQLFDTTPAMACYFKWPPAVCGPDRTKCEFTITANTEVRLICSNP